MQRQGRTDCSLFQDIFDRPTQVMFDQNRMSSDGGILLAVAADRRLNLTASLADSIIDRRRAGSTRHGSDVLIRQRIYGLVCGYQDANDVAVTGSDPLMRLSVRNSHTEPLASQSTISRFENSLRTGDLYRLYVRLVESVIKWHRKRFRRRRVRRITIDIDGTVDPTHGQQQLTFFNAFYDTHCYKPLLIFISFDDEAEQYLLCAVPRPGNVSDKAGTVSVMKRIIPRLQEAFPSARLRARMDGGFASEEIFEFLESHSGLEYAINLPKNRKIERMTRTYMRKARGRFRRKEKPRVYGECLYGAKKWSRKRRIIVKAEIVTYPGRPPRENFRFLVTNMKGSPRRIYEEYYCARGDSENRIKELKDTVGLDRTSCSAFNANQLRVLLSAAAYVLLQEIRRSAARTSYSSAQVHRIVYGLIKIAARITVSVRRILIQMPSSTPARAEWQTIARRLGASPA